MPKKKSSAELSDAVGQLLIIGFEGAGMSAKLESLLREVQPSGVILFARNIVSVQQTHELLQACRRLLPVSPFLCVDMEGGLVDRLKKALEPAPAPAEVFASGDRKLFRRHGRIIGEECRSAGFNVDFAPVSDLATAVSRSVLASRAVSADAKEVSAYVGEFLRGLKSAGVLGCGKHFPGLGEGRLDSHQYLPVINKPWEQLWGEDLIPYRKLRREFPFVMVAHAAYPAVTRDSTPASLSRFWITDILRKKIGFKGLVISDDLEMGGVTSAAPVEQAAVAHIRAGGDICLICHKENVIRRAYEALADEAQRDTKFSRQVKEAVKRIANFKKKTAVLRRHVPAPTPESVQRLTRQIWEFSEQVRLEIFAREEQV
ncbi:MAG TPA: beta-N-acetylhexosaminidase [Terriglobales bacterium]|nr:beta-N-acetylhexosaminidase [Terriglobales bacterium]